MNGHLFHVGFLVPRCAFAFGVAGRAGVVCGGRLPRRSFGTGCAVAGMFMRDGGYPAGAGAVDESDGTVWIWTVADGQMDRRMRAWAWGLGRGWAWRGPDAYEAGIRGIYRC